MRNLYVIIEALKKTEDLNKFIALRKKVCEKENTYSVKGDPTAHKGAFIMAHKGTYSTGRNKTNAINRYVPENEEINAGITFDEGTIKTGNIDNIYRVFFSKLKELNQESINIQTISKLIFAVIEKYFERGNEESYRKRNYLLGSTNGPVSFQNLREGKAMCTERALLAQNLFKMIGIDSVMKQMDVLYNEKNENHVFNIVRANGENYIFDAAIPTTQSDKTKNPLVGQISDEEYMLLVDGKSSIGVQTKKLNNSAIYGPSYKKVDEEMKRFSTEEIATMKKQSISNIIPMKQFLENAVKDCIVNGYDISRITEIIQQLESSEKDNNKNIR